MGGGIKVGVPIAALRNHTYTGAAFDMQGEKIAPYLEGNNIYVDVNVYRGPGQPAVQVKKGAFTLDVPIGWDRNSDKSAFEVVNERGIPMFQMVYLTPSDITLRGIFVFREGVVVAANETTMAVNPTDPFRYAPKPIFKYPSRLHYGEPLEK
jgi:hypothetical protein